MALSTSDIFFSAPEYALWRTATQLKEDYGIEFETSGWYELSNGDTVLIIERHGKYKVWLWIGADPMDEMEKVLDLPRMKVKD